jgi:hypothetical protein
MANEIIPPSTPFTRAVAQVKAKRRAEGVEDADGADEASLRQSPRARLNFIPDDSMLSNMIDRALLALSRGARWARGSILNLLV